MVISRNTSQKKTLEKEVKKFKTFFTAEELLVKVKKSDSKIGIATVYRFLKDLTSKGKIHNYTCNRKTIYSLDKKSHCHFTCEKCGRIEHIEIKSLDFFRKKVTGSICHFQIDVSGVCERCGEVGVGRFFSGP